MKNQYFGDRRDLIKYDLLLELMARTPSLTRLVNIPMLTPDDRTNEGRTPLGQAGNHRADLHQFLASWAHKEGKGIRELQTLFRNCSFEYSPYRDDAYFKGAEREEYFQGVPQEWLESSLVFLDPDIGLETRTEAYMGRKGIEKYLFWRDLRTVVTRANGNVLVVVYQHLQRNMNRVEGDIQERCNKMFRILGSSCGAYVRDDHVSFLAAPLKGVGSMQLLTIMAQYVKVNNLKYRTISIDLSRDE
jgi:hypothetical protein